MDGNFDVLVRILYLLSISVSNKFCVKLIFDMSAKICIYHIESQKKYTQWCEETKYQYRVL